MITGEIKTKIDAIWDIFWTGGITNPVSVLEQMTYLFFMKMLDDAQLSKEAGAEMLGTELVNPVFKKEALWHNPLSDKEVPYERLRWHVFKHFEAEAMFRLVRDDVFPFIKNLDEDKGSAYGRFMQNAVFLIQAPRTLVRIVAGIDDLDMNDRDTMGDVYEYILGKMAASGNNGQFRTPRHIIRMMVEMMAPTLSDRICDPAMGTAGFIVEAAKYIRDKYGRSELLEKKNLDYFRHGMFNGYDTDATMLRIGAMNLMLHDVDDPGIRYRDSLSSDNPDESKYSLILANPPFSGKLDATAVSKSLLSIANTRQTELLFVALFVRMLRLGGRCASIVPDGVLFGGSTAHKALRKELVDHQKLEAVISLPAGVFQPYSGVSTAILIFTKTNAGGTDKVWFYDMKADGFSLNAKRDPVPENDIPDVIARFRDLKSEETRTRRDPSFLVPADEIRDNGYLLSLSRYKETERDETPHEDPAVILDRLLALQSDITAALTRLKSEL